MVKSKTVFFCQNCGAESAKWQGRCPSCNEWNTYVEEKVESHSSNEVSYLSAKSEPINIKEADTALNSLRFSSRISELDRVLGGGIVAGSLVLVGGDPGIGKSTLLLQMALALGVKVLFVSGEESTQQIKMRADRLGIQSDHCYLLAETSLSSILNHTDKIAPQVLIVDSIQTLHSEQLEAAIGSISQVKECGSRLMKYAKQKNVPIFLIGHVNKDGAIAGPKVLEHLVDTVVQFEGDRHLTYRMLRTIKNRFGSTSELGVFEMNANGLREVLNPSEILMTSQEDHLSGAALGAVAEGNRILIHESQALVSPSSFGNPQRSSTGYDNKRLNMLLAVMEKRLGLRLGAQDVFLNIAGGIKIQDTGLDLSICVALFSSFEDIPVDRKCCFAAEVGLGGELRPLNKIENRIIEAEKLGFEHFFMAKHKALPKTKIKLHTLTKLNDLIQRVF